MRRSLDRELAWRAATIVGLTAAALALELFIISILTALPLLFFWRVLAADPNDAVTFPLGDFTELHFPYRHWAAEQIALGRLPVWNPFVSAGHPSLGDIQFGLLYPVGVLFARLADGDLTLLQLEQQVIAHFSIALVGMYLFARVAGAGRAGGVLAALVFGFSGYMTSFPVQQIIILQTSVWLPWILLGLELAIGRREPLWAIVIAGATAMAALVGHPQTLAYVLGMATLYGLYRLAVQPSLGGLLGAAAGGLLGLALAAPALLPALEHLRVTGRTDVGYEFTSTGFPPYQLIGLILPTFIGGQALFVGIGVLALAWIGLNTRARDGIFWTAVAAAGLILSMGGNTFLYSGAYAVVPGMQFFRNHERTALIVSVALAMLAARGLHALVGHRRGKVLAPGVGLAWLPAFGGLMLLVGLYLQLAAVSSEGDLRFQQFNVAGRATLTAFVALLVAGVLYAARRLLVPRWAIASAVVALIALDLFTTGWTLNARPGHPDQLLRPSPTVQYLRGAVGDLDRIASEGHLPADGNAGALYRLPDIVGNSPLDLQAYQTFDKEVDEFTRWRLLAVRFVTTKREIGDPRLIRVFREDDLHTYELRRDLRLPRAWMVHRAIVASGLEDELDLTRRLKLEEEVILAEPLGEVDGRPPDRPPAQGTNVAIESFEPDRIVLRTWSPRDAVLVLSERAYPGWTATVDGQPTMMTRANYVLRAIFVPGGEHRVVVEFEPPGLEQGLEIAAAATLVAGVLIALRLLLPVLAWSVVRSRGILPRQSAPGARRIDRPIEALDSGAGDGDASVTDGSDRTGTR